MCRLPMMRAPASGFLAACCRRSAMSPGISCSARRISLRPNSASARFFTLNGSRPAAFAAANGCIFSATVAIVVFSFGSLPGPPSRRREKQARTFGLCVWRQRDDARVVEAAIVEDFADVLVGKPEPHVAHLLPVVLSIVRQHVDDEGP